VYVTAVVGVVLTFPVFLNVVLAVLYAVAIDPMQLPVFLFSGGMCSALVVKTFFNP
jgi:H+/gluconate symporter-like permease